VIKPGEVRGGAAFTAFQAKLATVVTNAPALGKRVGTKPGCCCPLGAHPEALSRFPFSMMARDGGWKEVEADDLVQFINGFGDENSKGPYSELGRAYRGLYP
jgi:hypothetical protein